MTQSPTTLALITLLAMSAHAEEVADEEAADKVDNIVVTGTRATDLLSEIPNTTTVIQLEELEMQNAVSVPDALRRLPGVHVVQPSGQGGVARIFVRGGDQNLTMILRDGVRMNDPNDTRGSAFDFSTINLNDIERIEIVRGPQSAVYGSDALAGVINIISKDHADELSGSLFAEGGSDDFIRAALDLSGPVGGGGFSLRMATKDDGEPVTGTTFESDSLSARMSFGQQNAWNLNLIGNYSDSEGTAFPEDSGGSELAVLRETDSRSAESLRLGLDGRVSIAENWDLNVLATWYDHDSGYLSPGVAPGVRDPMGVPPNGAESNLQRADLALNAVAEINDSLTATFGMDYYDEEGTSDGFVEFFPGFVLPAGFEFNRNVTGAFGELHYKSDLGPILMASIRRDDSSAEEAETTSRLGVLYDFNDGGTTLRANWGQGFSLPGFFALASPLVGNPDLLPETSESFDVGISHRFGDTGVQATVALFHNEFENLIDFEASVFQMINRDRLEVDGVEIQLDYALSEDLSIHLQTTYLDLDLVNSDAQLRQRPDWRAGLTLHWVQSERWLVDASWLYAGESFDTSIPTGNQFLDSYSRADVTVTYRHNDRLHAIVSINNLFDENYYEAIGFPAPGTRGRIGIRYRF